MAHLSVRDMLELELPPVVKARNKNTGRIQDLNLRAWTNHNLHDLRDVDTAEDKMTAGLKLTIEATAADTMINKRIYTGKSCRRAHSTFRGKPMLKHHDSYSDPIGRITSSKFEQLLKGSAFDTAWKNPAVQVSGKVKGQPSGKTLVKATITDADAIMKIEDGRLLHVSQGGRASTAKCSVCEQDWIKDGWCEHTPGEVYKNEDTGKKQLMYFIMDIDVYDELSFVNTPAWSKAQVLTIDNQEELVQWNKRKIKPSEVTDRLLDNYPQEWTRVKTREIVLFDALGDELVIVEDGESVSEPVINISKEVTDDRDPTSVANPNDAKENSNNSGVANMEKDKLEQEVADLRKQVKVLTNELSDSKAKIEEIEADKAEISAAKDKLTEELEGIKSAQVVSDAEYVVTMREALGLTDFENDGAREKEVEDYQAKGAVALKAVRDEHEPKFKKLLDEAMHVLKDKDNDEADTTVNRELAGGLQDDKATSDQPNAGASITDSDEDDLLL